MNDFVPRIRLQRQPTTPKVRVRVLPALLPLNVSMQNTGATIQWRIGSGPWMDLITIDDINASVSVGTVTTLPPGQPATVVNVGTPQDVILNFGIPSGGVGSVNGKTGVVVLAAGDIGVTPTGNIASTDIQSALAELDSEKQPLDSDLTSWALLTRASGFDGFVVAPTSANLRALLTDESGSGATYFQGGDIGTPSAGVATNLTGTAAALTAGHVTTNANLTGPVTSVGNATAIASQTGTGTKFVVDTSPTIVTPTIAGTSGAQATLTASLTDTSGAIATPAKFWSPTYFGNAGTAVIHRFNRLMVGEGALGSGDLPMTTPDWLEIAASSTTSAGQISSVSTIGGLGVVGASRSSDFRSWAGSASGGAEGVLGIGWNDDATAATTPIAVGGEFRGWRKTGVVGLTAGAQISASNNGSTIDITPHSGIISGATTANLITAGPGPTGYTNPISVGVVLGSGDGTSTMRKGIVSLNGALDTSVGAGTGGVAAELYTNQSIRWLNSSDATVSEMWGNGNGLVVNSTVSPRGTTDFFAGINAVSTKNGSNSGPNILSYRNNPTPGISDNLGAVFFQGNNLTPANVNAAALSSRWAGSVTAGAESAAFDFQTVQGGSFATRMTLAAGVAVGGSATDKGAGTVNANGYYALAGTTAIAPVNLTAGTNLTTPVAGALEFDGKSFYATAAASSRQVINAEQVTILSADNTAPTNVATAQNVFPTGQGTLTVQGATTYEFEAEYEIDSTGTTSNALQTLFGGTATFTSISYSVVSTNSSNSSVPAAASMRTATVATAISATAAVAAATQRQVRLRGTMRINAAGTVIPQFQFSAAPGVAPVVRANSFFRCWPVGSNTVTSVGNWS